MTAYHENLTFDDNLPVKVILHTDPNWKKKDVLSHWHNSIELTYIVDGDPGTAIINGDSYTLKEHQLYVIGPNVIHSFDTTLTYQDEILTLLIPLNWLSDKLDYYNQVHFDVGPIDLNLPKYQHLLNSMQAIVAYKRKNKNGVAEQLDTVSALHYMASFVLTQRTFVGKQDLELSSPIIIQEIMQKIQNEYQTNITIEQLSEDNHVSVAHLIRLFKKYVGVSPKNYLIQTRLSAATKLLKDTDNSIETIAEQTGFGSTKNFFVLFRKRYRVTPSEYRQNNQELV